MELMRHGMDTIELSFQGSVSKIILKLLEEAKAEAVAQKTDTYGITINGVKGVIGQTGAKGGYAYRFDTGHDGAIWLFKKNHDPNEHNIRVSVSSCACALYGFRGISDYLFGVLDRFGAQILGVSPARIDWAFDFKAEEFILKPYKFIYHSQTVEKVYREGQPVEFPSEVKENEPMPYNEVWRGGRCTTVTLGTMPNRQVQVYDKRRELSRKVASHWYEFWGTTKEDCPHVWRLEVRLGKNYLMDWNVRSFEDLDEKLGDMLLDSLKAVRLYSTLQGQNKSRDSVDHEMWVIARQTVVNALYDHIAGAKRGKIRENTRQAFSDLYRKQHLGLIIPRMIIDDLEDWGDKGEDYDEVEALINLVSADIREKFHNEADDIEIKLARSSRRLHFLEKIEEERQHKKELAPWWIACVARSEALAMAH